MSGCAIVRCDASDKLGHGHFKRCLSLAGKLYSAFNYEVTFAMIEALIDEEEIRSKGFDLELFTSRPPNIDTEEQWLRWLIAGRKASVLVLDIRTNLDAEALRFIRDENEIKLAVIDDASDRRKVADLAFYPPSPQVKKFDWKGARGQYFSGWQWVLLGSHLSFDTPTFPRGDNEKSLRETEGQRHCERLKLLVTAGATDPHGLTMRIIEPLLAMNQLFDVSVVAGPHFRWRDELRTYSNALSIMEDVEKLPSEFAAADIAITAFGVSAFELAHLGTPAIHLCVSADHFESSSAFQSSGIALSLPVFKGNVSGQLKLHLTQLWKDPDLRSRMSERGAALVDGCGAHRIAEKIALFQGV